MKMFLHHIDGQLDCQVSPLGPLYILQTNFRAGMEDTHVFFLFMNTARKVHGFVSTLPSEPLAQTQLSAKPSHFPHPQPSTSKLR